MRLLCVKILRYVTPFRAADPETGLEAQKAIITKYTLKLET